MGTCVANTVVRLVLSIYFNTIGSVEDAELHTSSIWIASQA